MSVHIHYVIACLAFEILFAILHRESTNTKQIFGLLLIPASLYFFVYQHPLLPLSNLMLVYITSVLCFVVTIFICSLSSEPHVVSKVKAKTPVFLAVASFILFIFIYGIPWLIKAFPLENSEAILFTLSQNKSGTEGFVWNLIWVNILRPVLSSFVPISIFFFILSAFVFYSKKTWFLRIFHFKIRIRSGENIWVTLKQLYAFLFICLLIIFCMSAPKLTTPLLDLCKVYFDSNMKQNSQLYLNDYIFPDSVSIAAPQKRKNLIYIMMESMEVNFEDYTPEINRIAKENISFKPGGIDVAMTGWTMAAQVSKICGIPLNLPNGMENSDSIYSFLPNLKCLTDILAKNDYNQIYVQGSDGSFSSKRNFWRQHNVINFHDFVYYKEKNIISEKKEIYWGVTDKTLYGLIRKELDEVTHDTTKPFALYAMTVDTHFPEGHLSEGCIVSEIYETQYPSILNCASSQIDSFLEWAKKQNWYENTVVVLVGDHTWSTFTELLRLPKDAPLYWINIFLNTRKEPLNTNRYFSSFDMFPTVLEALNFEIDGHRLGLGTSLFSDEKTLLEKMPKTILDSLLRIKSYQYDYFMQGGSFVGE